MDSDCRAGRRLTSCQLDMGCRTELVEASLLCSRSIAFSKSKPILILNVESNTYVLLSPSSGSLQVRSAILPAIPHW